MFFDYNKIRKVELGTKKITKREDFLKQVKEDNNKEIEKQKVAESNKSISQFINKLIKNTIKSELYKETLNNLKSIIQLLKIKTDFDKNKIEKIVLATFDKTNGNILKILKSKNLNESATNDLIIIVLDLLGYISNVNLINFISSNLQLIRTIFTCSILNYYKNLKKDVLIDSNRPFFIINGLINTNNLIELLTPVYSYISKNMSSLYILSYILNNIYKLIDNSSKIITMKFCLSVADQIIINRKKIKSQGFPVYTNTIATKYLEDTIKAFLDMPSNLYKNILTNLNIDLFLLFNFPVGKNYLLYLSEDKLAYILTEVSTSLSNNFSRKNILSEYGEEQVNFFINLFSALVKKDINFNSQTYTKMDIDRKYLLKFINDILELTMEANANFNFKKIESLIKIIYSASKLIEHLYHTNYEKSDFHSILDYIFNKIALKYNSILCDEILIYSVNLIQTNINKINISNTIPMDILEIISFAILNKIEYKDNYFFVEFRNGKDIYQNIPFNYMYLNYISKFLIQIFTQLIAKANLDDIEKLNQNMVIKALKSLFLLDGEIDFSFNRELFWTNMELISKLSGSSQLKQIECMKIMPFIFPFNYRLTLLNHIFTDLKKTRLYEILNSEEEIETDLVISREYIFDETLNLYLNNKLVPFVRWKITFVDKFGNREEGVDAGGLYKEYLYKLSETAFSPSTGFFIESNSGFLMPNPNSNKLSSIHLKIFEFLGFIIGIGLIDDIKLWPNFSLFFLNNVLEVENPFTELKSYDPDLYKNLVNLKNYEGDVENDFGLDFTLNEERDGKTYNIELIEGGSHINVTKNNKLLYIKKVAQYKLRHQIKQQYEAFRKGLISVCDDDILKVFTADELRQLIYGFDKDSIDVTDLKMNTEYGTIIIINTYLDYSWNFNDKKEKEALNNFWAILNEFDVKEREKFLFFVTSLKRPPLGVS